MNTISQAITSAVQKVFGQEATVELTRPDEQVADHSTNVALQLAGKEGKPPRKVAEQLVAELKTALSKEVKEVTIAGPGFINLTLADAALLADAQAAPNTKPQTYKGK